MTYTQAGGHALPGASGDLGRRLERVAAPALWAWIIFGAGVLLLAAWAVLGTLMYLDQRERMPDNPAWIGPLVIGVFLVPLGLILAVKGFRGRLYGVDVHEGGLRFYERGGGVTLPWAFVAHTTWEEFEHRARVAIAIDVPFRRTATLRVLGLDGRAIVIDERLPGHVDFGRRVREQAARVMLPRYEAEIAAGRAVSFGPLAFDRDAVYLPAGAVPWSAVSSVHWASDGASAWWAVVGPDGQSYATFANALVPDSLVLAALLDRLGKLGAQQASTTLGEELVAAARRMLGR
ncbi:MAG: DUF6585 family protein [Byssovorax sp.]